MKLLFTICARAGSKGVKNKNIKCFLEYPILYYTLSAYRLFVMKYGKQYDNITLAINTDSDELIRQAVGTKVSFAHIQRKEALAGDQVSKPDVIKDTIKEMEEAKRMQFEYIIDLDLTSPLRTAEDIKGVLDTLLADHNADIAFSATGSRRLPFFNMVSQEENGYYLPLINKGYVTRQQAPECYDMNASIYAYKRDFILSENTRKVFDGKALAWIMKDTAVLDIDSEEDLELMQVLARYFYTKYGTMGEVYQQIKEIL